METPREIWRDFANTALCLGELAIWAIQDVCIAVDDNLAEFPDV